jgi:hypothetical protein
MTPVAPETEPIHTSRGSRSASRLFVALLAATAVYRFTLLDRGATAFVDETFYFTSVMTLQSLSAGDVHNAVANIAAARGRHGATLLQLPVAALQAVPSAFGIPASNLRSLLIPAAFNVAVSLVILYFFWEICTAVSGNERAALSATVVYALMVNTNLYLRHVLPYDWALCAGMWALWLAMTRSRSLLLPAWTGLLVGTMVTIYTGYYLFAAVVGAACVGEAWRREGWRRAARFAAIFGAAAAAVIVAMELIFRGGGLSYVGGLLAQSRDIVFTSADDGWTFLPEYLAKVERLSGIVLLAGAAIYLYGAGRRIRSRCLRLVDCLLLPAFAGWAWQAASSAHFHSIPLYGRLLHPWMPFLAWALADSLSAFKPPRLRGVVSLLIVIAALASWAASARAYYRLAYPPTVLYSLGIDTARLPPDRFRCELYPGTSYASPGPFSRETRFPYTDASNDILLNFCQALPEVPRPRVRAAVDEGATMIFDGPHWMTFPAYAFEGLVRADRDAMSRNDYRVRVFRLTPTVSPR